MSGARRFGSSGVVIDIMRTLAALLSIAALSAPLEAHAFCLSTTNTSFVPSEAVPCDTTGKPLFWASRCITMLVNRNASAKVPLQTAQDLLEKSLAKWSAFTCDACGTAGSPSIVADESGVTDCGFGFLRQGTNTNVMIFYDTNWPREPGQLALTTVTFKTDTGEILDADLEINSTQNITLNGEPDGYDLESIMTHEAGHVLGLAHSQDPKATMRPTYDVGDTSLRNLTQDDECGLCASAPPNRDAPCNPTSGTCTEATGDAGTTPDAATPDGGATPDAATPAAPETGNPADAPGYTCGCSTPGRASPLGWTAIAVAVAVASRLRSRTARSSRSPRPSCTRCSR